VGNFTTGKQPQEIMIHRSGNPFMQNQHSPQPMRLSYCASRQVFSARSGFTNFLENDGSLEAAQRIAGHADSRTTKLYDRRGQKVLLEYVERMRY
jgi:hypothetical protein